MKKLSEETGLLPGESSDTIDLDYCGCLGYCSEAPNVAIDDTSIVTATSQKTVMKDIKKGGKSMLGQELSESDAVDSVLQRAIESDILGDLV